LTTRRGHNFELPPLVREKAGRGPPEFIKKEAALPPRKRVIGPDFGTKPGGAILADGGKPGGGFDIMGNYLHYTHKQQNGEYSP
jgi:hypothetical protein